MRTCPDCHSLVDDNAIFCDNCGFRLSPVEREVQTTIKAEIPRTSKPAEQPPAASEQTGACSSCGFLNMPGEMFCQNCGVQLAPVASSPPTPPELVPPPVSTAERPSIPQQELPAPAPAPTTPEALPEGEQKPDIVGCPNCGFQNFVGEKFCQNCGQFLMQAVKPPSEPVPVVSPEPISEQKVEPIGRFPEASGVVMTEGEAEGPQPEEILIPVEEPPAELALEEFKSDEMVIGEASHLPASPEESGTAAPIEAPAEPDELTEPEVEPAEPGELTEPEVQPAEPGELTEPEAEPAEPDELTEPEAEPAPPQFTPVPPPSMDRGITGRLVVRNTGVEIPLPSGHDEITIGRVDLIRNVFPDLDMTGYGGESGGVSRMHARLVLQGSQLYIEDLNSTNYTFVNKLRLQPGQPYLVSDGDEIRLGLLAMIFHTA